MARPLDFGPAFTKSVAPLLPPEFDPSLVEAFFSKLEELQDEMGRQTELLSASGHGNAEDLAAVDLSGLTQSSIHWSGSKHGDTDHQQSRAETSEAHQHSVDALPPEHGLEKAHDHAATDLYSHAAPLQDDWTWPINPAHDFDGVDATDDDTIYDSAEVKPSNAGGGGGGGKGGGGKGKGAVTTDPDPTPPVASDPTTTDPGSTDTGTTDTTSPTGEINPGATSENTYVSGMDAPDGYNIELVFHGDWTDDMKSGFVTAAEDISDIITNDIENFNGIDDFRLNLYAKSIDGSGGALANGGWMSMRDDPERLVAEGGINVDTADIQMMINKGIYEDMAFHETLHAMGFGTTWRYTGLTEETETGTRFVGTNAIEAYNDIYSDIAANDPLSAEGVPLSNDDAHWQQSSFGTEIMSPKLNFSDNVLSDLTIAALEDMGYETTYGDEEEEPLLFV